MSEPYKYLSVNMVIAFKAWL